MSHLILHSVLELNFKPRTSCQVIKTHPQTHVLNMLNRQTVYISKLGSWQSYRPWLLEVPIGTTCMLGAETQRARISKNPAQQPVMYVMNSFSFSPITLEIIQVQITSLQCLIHRIFSDQLPPIYVIIHDVKRHFQCPYMIQK